MKQKHGNRRGKKPFRRTVRRIVKDAFRYYSLSVLSLFLALAVLAAILILRHMGRQFSGKTWIFLLFLTLFFTVVGMLGAVAGMAISGFRLKRKDEHIERYFSGDARAGKTEGVPAARLPLRMDERAGRIENAVFMIAALLLWLGGDWLLRLWIGGSFAAAWEVSFLTLLLTWFPAVRLARLIRTGYERIVFYKPHALENQSEEGERRHEQAE